MADHDADETSPLLQDATRNQDGTTTSGEADLTAGTSQGPKNDEERREQGSGNGQHEGMPEVKARLKYIVPAFGIGIFLAAADSTLIASCYGKIGSDLKALNKASWISTAYFLSQTSFQPLYGKLSDIFGRKACLLFAYTIFGIGALYCGLARTVDELIVARAITGIGGAGMNSVVSIIMSDIVTLRERGTWQGIINIIYACGSGSGAPLGGILADYIGWRWAFLAQAPLCALAIASVGVALNLPPKNFQDWRTKIRRVDFLGAFVLILAVFALLLGLDRGSNDSWSSPLAIGSLCLSFPLFFAFGFIEFRISAEPIAPKRIVFERNLIACYLCNFFAFSSWMAILFYLPLFYQTVDDLSASQAGVRLLPAVAVSGIGALSGGLIMQRTGKFYWLTVVAYTVSATATLVIMLFSGVVVQSIYAISTGLAFLGLAFGLSLTSTLIGLIANVSHEDQATATACSYLSRSLGSVVGVSLASTIVQQSLRLQLQGYLNRGKETENIVTNVRESLEYIRTLRPDLQKIVVKCYGTATRYSFIFAFCIATCAMLSSCKFMCAPSHNWSG